MARKKRNAARKSAKTSRKKTRKSPAKSRTAAKSRKAKSRARNTAPKRRRSSRKTAVRRGGTQAVRQPNTLRDRETPPPGAVEQMLETAADTSRKAARKVKEILNL